MIVARQFCLLLVVLSFLMSFLGGFVDQVWPTGQVDYYFAVTLTRILGEELLASILANEGLLMLLRCLAVAGAEILVAFLLLFCLLKPHLGALVSPASKPGIDEARGERPTS